MPKADFADITIILDRSGSMSAIQDATLKGFNDFVSEQKKVPGDGCWSLVQFDDRYETVYSRVPQDAVQPLTCETFNPRGSTALLDAVCRTIDETGRRIAALSEPERPSKVLVVIITDGYENASREFRAHDLAKRIAHQRDKYNWQFLFLGANQDAIATAAQYGIGAGHAMTYQATPKGTEKAYASLNNATRTWKLDGNQTADQLFVEPTPEVNVTVNVNN